MFSAVADDDLARLVVESVEFPEFSGNGFLQFVCPGCRRIFGKAFIDRFYCRIADILRRSEIRLTCAESDNIDAIRTHLFCFRGYGQRG
jgi:hypothetical protein